MPRTSRQSSPTSIVATVCLSAVPIVGLFMQYTGDPEPSATVIEDTGEDTAEQGVREDMNTGTTRSSGRFVKIRNPADALTANAVERAAARAAAEAFSRAGPSVTEIVPVATSEATSEASE